MPDQNIGKIQPIEITKELQKSYLDYAMSVIVARALPDVKDGLKPVHRRILYAMYRMGLRPGGAFTKSAKVVGEVLGKYHPHGDMPVYDALVRLAQDFSMRYPLVDGQGNFGSVDGDPPAAMRYTEVRLPQIALEMLADLDSDTLEWTENFDATLKEPVFLPAKLPNLLLMGADGIAVGMATKIPPHNLREIAAAITITINKGAITPLADGQESGSEFAIKKIELEVSQGKTTTPITEMTVPHFSFDSDVTTEELVALMPGPDFPTGGAIYDAKSLVEIYATGRGKIIVRGIAKIEEGGKGKTKITITEIPYQVNKSQLVARIAQLARDKKIVGISDLRDESDRTGMSVVIELKKDAKPKAVLNNLYKHTALQSSFPANFVALVDGVPHTLTLKRILTQYIDHRQQVVVRRTVFELRESRRRAHILDGLKIALDNLDAVIETIRRAADADEAKSKLMSKFGLSELQTIAILDMQLRRLARLEREKIEAEWKELQAKIKDLEGILTTPKRILEIIQTELKELTAKYGDERRTKIYQTKLGEFSQEDLVAKEETLITLTSGGYIKRVPLATYRQQARGGKGVLGMSDKKEDEIVHLTSASTHDQLLAFTDRGRVFATPVWEIPETSRLARGQALVNLINIEQGEEIQTILPMTKEGGHKFLLMATQKGVIKKTALTQFANIRSRGITAIKLEKGDKLVWVKPTLGTDHVLLVTQKGKAIKFREENVRSTGRDTMGVRGIRLSTGDTLVGMEVIASQDSSQVDGRKKPFTDVLVVTEHGIGKRTPIKLFTVQGRGGVGIKLANINSKTGSIVSAFFVTEDIDQIVITSRGNQVIKMPLRNVPVLGRNTQGVILMRFADKGDTVAAVATLEKEV
ncbi:DNA gyrase subunit A [Candidatus Microgenomates bacterium]|nr:DNA gyrase subunit A [Candidatus Microgenomates bacterium]